VQAPSTQPTRATQDDAKPGPTYSSQPGRHASHAAISSGHVAAGQKGQRPRRHGAGAKASEVSGVGLVTIEGNQKPAVRVRVNPAASPDSGQQWRTSALRSCRTTSTHRRGVSTAAINRRHRRERPDLFPPPNTATSSSLKNGSPVRLGDLAKSWTNVENVRWPLVGDQPTVILDIQRQPARTSSNGEPRKALLPKLRSAIPPSVKFPSSRPHADDPRVRGRVQFTLLLTFALVVMVIFVFLRKFWADRHSEIALPLPVWARSG